MQSGRGRAMLRALYSLLSISSISVRLYALHIDAQAVLTVLCPRPLEVASGLCSRLRPDVVRDRQTSYTHHRLCLHPTERGGGA